MVMASEFNVINEGGERKRELRLWLDEEDKVKWHGVSLWAHSKEKEEEEAGGNWPTEKREGREVGKHGI